MGFKHESRELAGWGLPRVNYMFGVRVGGDLGNIILVFFSFIFFLSFIKYC